MIDPPPFIPINEGAQNKVCNQIREKQSEHGIELKKFE
jgi:hypothetical protein